MLLGDTHGNLAHWYNVLNKAEKLGVTTILQVGDFGFWPRFHPKYIHKLERMAGTRGIEVFWIDGNHEDHESIALFPPGLHNLTSHVTFIPRGEPVELCGYKILCCGGAYSIDQGSRTEGLDWFPGELITYADIAKCLEQPAQDIIVTHDCPEVVPHTSILPRGLYPIAAARSQRVLLNEMYEVFHPPLWVHGHYHHRYEWESDTTKFIGLDCDPYDESILILPEKVN